MPDARTLLVLGALGVLGCGTDVAQTAVRAHDSALVCQEPSAPPVLPSAPELGGGAVVGDWELATGDYGVNQGPGITVAARDGFRLFVNGHLLAESTESLTPRFVPLTLLPGDNVVAVVVTATSADPALLLQLDELEREIVTDASWKASATPSGDWMLPGFDDSGWQPAVDHGSLADNPGCAPAAGFPAGSPAHWLTASGASAAFRLAVHVGASGYGAGTTGGEGATPVTATDVNELSTLLEGDDATIVLVPEGVLDVKRQGDEIMDFSTCPTDCPDGSGKLTYNVLAVDSMCDRATVPKAHDEHRFRVGSNKTLVGLGRGALLRGAWLDIGVSHNVIVRNVALYDVNAALIEAGDGISVTGADQLWIDHVTFKWISDGFIDVSGDSSNMTLSWLRFDGANDAACQERHPRANEMVNPLVTFHHTYWTHVNGRAPLITHALARAHLYSDVFSDDVDYAVGAGCDAEILLEGSYFENVRAPTSKRDCTDGTVGVGAIDAPAGSNAYGSGVGSHESAGTASPEPRDAVFTPPYAYELDPTDEVRFRVTERAGAGARWALPLETSAPRP